MKTFKQFSEEVKEPTEALRRLERMRDKRYYDEYKKQQNPKDPNTSEKLLKPA